MLGLLKRHFEVRKMKLTMYYETQGGLIFSPAQVQRIARRLSDVAADEFIDNLNVIFEWEK